MQEFLRKFVPDAFEISSGFIIDKSGAISSRQIDLLIYDRLSPKLYQSTNFVIIQKEYARAVIEVKSKLTVGSLRDSLRNLYEAQQILQSTSDRVYTGIFAFESDLKTAEKLAESLMNEMVKFYRKDENVSPESFVSKYTLTSLCVNKTIYGLHLNSPKCFESNHVRFRFYDINNLSSGFFVSNLLNNLVGEDVDGRSLIWYPINKGGKMVRENHLLESF